MKTTIGIFLMNILGLSMLSIIVNMALPSGNFKKYSRFMINIVMLAVILKLFFNAGDIAPLDQTLSMNSSWLDRQHLEVRSQDIDRVHSQQIETMFKREVEGQIREQVESIAEGKVMAISVNWVKRDNSIYSIENIYVDLRHINTGGNSIEVKDGGTKDIAEYLSHMYNVPRENIIIEIRS